MTVRKPLRVDPDPRDIEAHIMASLEAWGRGDMTKAQQKTVLKWLVEDVCLALTPIPPLRPSKQGYMLGQQRVGKVLLKLTGARLAPSTGEMKND